MTDDKTEITDDKLDAFFDAEQSDEVPDDEPETIEVKAPEEKDKPEKPPEGYVPHGALHQEREERKRFQQEAEALKGQVQSLLALKHDLEQHRQQQKQQNEQYNEEKAYQEDPIGYLRGQNVKLQQELQGIKTGQYQYIQQTEQQRQQQVMLGQVVTAVRGHEEQFRQETPDYDDAFNFLQQRRMQDYDTMGVADPAQKQQGFYQEVLGVSVNALQQGKNPASVIYSLAKQWGYTGGGERLETVKKGQKMSKTLNGGGGRPEPSKVSLTDIEKMADDEFDQLWQEMERDSVGGR